jgi:hypothetical protein
MPDRSKGKGPGLPGWGLVVGLTIPLRNNLMLRNHGGGHDMHRVIPSVKKKIRVIHKINSLS